VLEKKARLGVDSWGSTDAGVRHIMDPIEATFAQEFPDFDPFPWGAQRWVHLLVRHVLLAEPMVGDFRRCFEGLSPDEAEALADGFRLDRCLQRHHLVEILRTPHGTTAAASR
jgi:endoglucanase